uniref:Uncharacterized protein n=1 Tax=Bracon brevicornis TaxID=1563983 RepID=A0A6V7LIW0_9HYME
MGNWQLEAAKMVGYIAFPVGIFHWFNQPDTFTEFSREMKEKYGIPPEEGAREKLLAAMEEINGEKDKQALDAMEKQWQNKK